MTSVALGGGRVHYEIAGDGPGLVLLHGTGGDADRVFGNVVDHFTGIRTVVRPNFSGSGDTEDGTAAPSVELLTAQAVAAIRATGGGEPVDLLGFSLGGAIAAAVAAEHPELVRRLVLVGSWAHTTGPRDRFNFSFWRDLYATDLGLYKRFMALQGFAPRVLDGWGHEALAAAQNDVWPAGVDKQIEVCLQVDLRERLSRVVAPTLVVGFTADEMVPIEGSRHLHAGIKDSRLVEIEGEGHMDWFTDPSRIIGLTRDFITA
ncbi:alpha/beta fold hydrolase [Nonomuraea roseoviolacea]|uniref:Pimeloyl-ACP methyl ester carboxylesterase n=1 Tax=Nonomuraea roseoviolacea subsp. carminata TaxID=160689 RepID=A0ABT1KCJ4_9ACTN|nr:alpha/beta hydrolase [Nonomuraea roseoviolacea]MCP2351387.1 pimeloyl-ACP methyl ester carboxylesterase [Nonomuraea roseoviolacea subsp. carminata]